MAKKASKRVHIQPSFRGEDRGDGGMRRVVEAQERWLPKYGWEVTGSVDDADVVNLHGTALVKQALAQDKPIVGSSHGLYWTGPYEWDRWALHANLNVLEICRIADEVTAPSEWVAQTLRRNLYKPVHTIYHGIEPEEWPEPGDPSGYVLWNKARFDPVSDPAPLDAVTAMLPQVNFVSTFGTSRENVQIVNARESDDKATGAVTYAQSLAMVMQASVYLCTTRETFGIGTLEAMAAGVPVVGYDWGGQREFIEQTKTGILVPPGDTVQLAAAIEYVLENRDEMGKAARAEVLAHWTWEQRIAGYAEVFGQALDRPWRGEEGKRVSIIIPVKDGADTIGDTIDSAVREMGPDDEILIGINPSTDETLHVANDHCVGPSSQTEIFEWPEDVHLSGNRNNLIERAKGRYILPLDADDQLQPGAVERMVAAFADRRVDVAYAGVEFLETDGERWHSGWPVDRFDMRSQVQGKNQIPYASMYRADVARWRGGYRRRCMTAEDADFWIRMFSFGARVTRVEGDAILYANMREGSLSATSERSNWWDWYPWSRDREAFPYGALIYGTQDWQPTIWPLDQPKITVVIPVGPGHEELALTAIDSVLAQTYLDWEVVLVNDGSTSVPHCPPWVRQLSTSAPGSGVAAARNIGVDAARTEWICFLDADDLLIPSALQELLDAAQQIPEAVPGFVYPDFVAEFADGRQEAKQLDDWSQPRMLAQAVHGITALYPHKAFLGKEGIRFDEKLPGWEDWDLGFQLADQGWCAYHLARPLYIYRMELGKRREENYAARDANKIAIRTKWTRYIDGGAVMPCRKCGGRAASGPAVVGGPASAQAAETLAGQDTVWVDYIGDLDITNTFKGAKSGTRYRFGGQRRGAYVLAADADGFRSRPHDFTVQAAKPSVTDRAAGVMLKADIARPEAAAPGPPPETAPQIEVGTYLRPDLMAMTVDDLRELMRNHGGAPARMRKEDLVDAILAYQVTAKTAADIEAEMAAQRPAAGPQSGERFEGRVPENAPRGGF